MYLAASWVMFTPLGVLDSSHLPTCSCGDLVNQAWFLSLASHAVSHGTLPLHTTLLDHPTGINTLDNASMPLLGVILSPITAHYGPTASLAVLARLGFFVSAVSMFWVARRLTRSRLAAGVAGAFYAFAPYMTHQGASHLFLTFVPLPPLMLYLVYSVVADPGARPFRTGLLFGALGAVQALISSEVLVSTLLLASVTLGIVGLRRARRARAWPLERLGRFAAASTAVGVALLAYPAWFALDGPQHVRGPTQSVAAPGIGLLSTLLPSDDWVAAGIHDVLTVPAIPLVGDTAFLGAPLLVVLAWTAFAERRRAVVLPAALLGVIAWVLALGPRLVVNGHTTRVPLPFSLLAHVPVVQDVIPSRLTLYVDMAAAVVLGLAVDRFVRSTGAARRPDGRLALSHPARPWLALAGALASAALTLPIRGYGASSIGAARDAKALAELLPSGGVVLAYPYPEFPSDGAMLWQAESGMSFSLLGGYALRPATARHTVSIVPPMLTPEAVQAFFLHASEWRARAVNPHSAAFGAAAASLPTFVARNDVAAIVVDETAVNSGAVADLAERAYGPPVVDGSLEVWRTRAGRGP